MLTFVTHVVMVLLCWAIAASALQSFGRWNLSGADVSLDHLPGLALWRISEGAEGGQSFLMILVVALAFYLPHRDVAAVLECPNSLSCPGLPEVADSGGTEGSTELAFRWDTESDAPRAIVRGASFGAGSERGAPSDIRSVSSDIPGRL